MNFRWIPSKPSKRPTCSYGNQYKSSLPFLISRPSVVVERRLRQKSTALWWTLEVITEHSLSMKISGVWTMMIWYGRCDMDGVMWTVEVWGRWWCKKLRWGKREDVRSGQKGETDRQEEQWRQKLFFKPTMMGRSRAWRRRRRRR